MRLIDRLDGHAAPFGTRKGGTKGIVFAIPGLDAVTALCAGPGWPVVVRLGGRWHVSPPVQTSEEAAQAAIGLVMAFDRVEEQRQEAEATERGRDTVTDRDEVRDIRRRLADPGRVVAALGLGKGARPSTRGVMVRCPAHEDSTASCSVRAGKDGTIIAVCHGCQWRGDVLGLVAAVRGLDPRREFRRVLEEAARLAGVTLGVRERRVA